MKKSSKKKIILTVGSLLMTAVMGFSFAACSEGPMGPQGPAGEQGTAGVDGQTPYIGANGNWWIGDIDTGVYAGDKNVPEEVEALQEKLVGVKDEVTGFLEANGMFYTDYEDIAAARARTKELNVEAALQGDVLMKNENDALPLKSHEKKVTMFGICSAYPLYGGGGAGSGVPDSYGVKSTSIKDSLEAVGMAVNPAVYSYYKNSYSYGVYGETVKDVNGVRNFKNTFYNYNDAAIVVIGRTGSEGSDLTMVNAAGLSGEDTTKHSLELTDGEKELVKLAKANFDKVIVLVNSANVIELGELAEKKSDSNLGVDAILWIGHTGNDQAAAIGPILKGMTNPSGHLADTWNYDLLSTPASKNVGSMEQNKDANGNSLDNYLYEENGNRTNWHSVEYREGIYEGYRYYETKCDDMNDEAAGSGESWYQSEVLYPFGHGLSYTTFDWELYGSTKTTGKISAANQTVTMQVKVTNTGKVAGRDVVQMYVNPPYSAGGIEKATANLMDFAKTDILAPGESQIVTLQCVAQDFASFDWNDANGNGFVGYELEEGEYKISAKRNSHDSVIDITRTVDKTIKAETDYTTGSKIEAIFSQSEGKWADYNSTNDTLINNLMSRADGLEIAAAASKEDRTVSGEFLAKVESFRATYAKDDKEEDYWYVKNDGLPSTWSQSTTETVYTLDAGSIRDVDENTPGTRHWNDHYVATRVNGEKTDIQLFDMAGVPFTDYKLVDGKVVVGTDEGSQKWEAFLNQLTWEEMIQLVSHGQYTRYEVPAIGMTTQADMDGSTQLGWSITTAGWADWICNALGTTSCFVNAITVASTWNKDLAYDLGNAMGNEALLINYDGLYGYSMNLHRSPFSGRNYEYYSEDGVLSGKIASRQTLGCTEKGVVTYIKHFALNDTETNRSGIMTYCTEQAMRELYLKPFEMCVKEGRSMGIMNAMCRIGSYKTGYANGALHDGLLRDEWNYKGITLTDASVRGSAFSTGDQMARNGVDLVLGTSMFQTNGVELCTYKDGKVYVHPDGKSDSIDNYDVVKDVTTEVLVNGSTIGGKPAQTKTVKTGTQYKMKDSVRDSLTLESATQYYAIRRAVLHILYITANGAGMRNGASDTVTVNATGALTRAPGQFSGAYRGWELYESIMPNNNITNCKVLNAESLPEWLTVDETGHIIINVSGAKTVAAAREALGLKDGQTTLTFTIEVQCVVDNRVGIVTHYTYTPSGSLLPTWDSDMGHPFTTTVTFTLTVPEA